MPPPATSEDLFDLVARSGLLTDDLLRPYRPPAGRPAPADALLARMTADGVVTPFHAKLLAAGRYRGFFLADKYKLLAHLGTGGMGHVYLCEHLMLQRLVAVKVLQTAAVEESGGAVERFFREARAVAALDHPNIVRVFDMDRSASAPFMVMEYVDGTNLHAVVAAGGPMTVARAAHYARQAALGLAHAHAAGLVHRDVKPGNLLVDRGGVVKLLDLGLARYFTDTEKNKDLTARFDADNVVGTADFIAPEQTVDSSAVDIRADIYSLGGTLYYFLAGRSPFEHGTVGQKLEWQRTKPPPPLASFRKGVPPGLVAVVEKMLAKNPDDRHATPTEVADALAPWGDRPVPPPTPDEMPKVPASAYRLGLSPPPSEAAGRLVPAPVATPAAPSRPARPPLPRRDPPTPIPPPRRSPASPTETVEAPTLAEPPPPPRNPIPGPASNRWWVVGSVVALLAAAALATWLILGGGR